MSNGLGCGVGEKAHLYKDSYKMQKKKNISDEKDFCVG